MALLTKEQFLALKERTATIFQDQDSKEALILGRQLEESLTEIDNASPLYQEYRNLAIQLKWLGLPLMQDENEYQELISAHFIEGLEMPEGDLNGPAQIIAQKASFLFGVGVTGFLNQIITALSENEQKIGSESITIMGEEKPSRPTIENWLKDFIRNIPSKQAFSEMAISDYLFKNPNAKKLSAKDKNLLSKILSFYVSFRQLNRDITEIEKQLPPIPTAELSTPPQLATETKRTEHPQPAVNPAPANLATGSQKTLRQLAQSNKESLNQPLTSAPIKIAEFDQPVRPTIKNWLVDYVKIKGAGHHEFLERSDYLFNNPNSLALSEKERELVSAILRAYDEDSPLPVSAQDQSILLDKIVSGPKSTNPNQSPNHAPLSRPTPAPAPQNTSAGYREKVSAEDLAGPFGQPTTPAKATPKLSGNVIDLKDLQ